MDLKKVIGAVAPWIGTAIGGPMGGTAVGMITKALGLPDGSKQNDLQQALEDGKLTPEQMLALKTADLEFQKAMSLAGIEEVEKLAQLANDDRNSARQREVQTKDITPRILAFSMVGGFFAVLTFLMFKQVPDRAHDAFMLLLGSLSTAFTGVIAYYFGSSAGSTEKTQLLAKASPIKE